MHLFAHRALKSPFSDRSARTSAGRFGLVIFLVSLGVLFLATVIGVVIVRVQLARDGLWPEDLPALPRALWLSTLVLLGGDALITLAARAESRNNLQSLRWTLLGTAVLAAAFIAIQGFAWMTWLDAVSDRWESSEAFRLALTGFYVLTGLHALHVLGGLIALIITGVRAVGDRDAARAFTAVQGCAWYWHFLSIIWILLFLTLLLLDR